MAVTVKVEAGKVTLALAAFRLGIVQRQDLMTKLGLDQLESIYKTFDEQGSPAGSWSPLSEVSRRWRKYTAGHKLLIGRGLLRNSIGVFSDGPDQVHIGTNLRYAVVHQKGFDGTQSVKPYSYTRHNRFGDRRERQQIINKAGRRQTVTRKTASGVGYVHVNGFMRRIRIPARPYLVFRPEDPERMVVVTQRFLVNRARAAGLEVTEE